jgi:hypothetical protein
VSGSTLGLGSIGLIVLIVLAAEIVVISLWTAQLEDSDGKTKAGKAFMAGAKASFTTLLCWVFMLLLAFAGGVTAQLLQLLFGVGLFVGLGITGRDLVRQSRK